MKLRIMSDLHLESQIHYYEYKGEDVLLLAGDISSKPSLYEAFVSTMGIDIPIIAIPGNHEYYGKNFDDHALVLKELGYLNNEIKVIDDVYFICGTMWTNFSLFNSSYDVDMLLYRTHGTMNEVEEMCRRGITDYNERGIMRYHPTLDEFYRKKERRFTIEDTKNEFKKFERFLDWALKETEGKKRVVVTHFCPGIRSVHEMFKNNLITAYFSTEMSHKMGWEGLWVHGHTHCNFDYMVGDTRVICNPKGYGRENLEGFNPNLIVEI